MRSRSIPLILLLSGLFALAGCNGCKGPEDDKTKSNGTQQPAPSGSTIRVGEYGSMTGSEAAFGESNHSGVMLAVDDINKAGGVLGKQIETVDLQDGSEFCVGGVTLVFRRSLRAVSTITYERSQAE